MEAAGSNNADDDVAGVQPVGATEVPSSSSFSPDSQKMPDWKKELLLKRKSKTTTTPATSALGDDDSVDRKSLDSGAAADSTLRSITSNISSSTSVASSVGAPSTSGSTATTPADIQCTATSSSTMNSSQRDLPTSSSATTAAAAPCRPSTGTIEQPHCSSVGATTTSSNTNNSSNNNISHNSTGSPTSTTQHFAAAQSNGCAVSNGTSSTSPPPPPQQRTAADGNNEHTRNERDHNDDDRDHESDGGHERERNECAPSNSGTSTQPHDARDQQSHSRHGTDRIKPQPATPNAPSERLTDAASAAAVVTAVNRESKSNAAAAVVGTISSTYEKNTANKPQSLANNKYVKLSEQRQLQKSGSTGTGPSVATGTSKMVAMPHAADQQMLPSHHHNHHGHHNAALPADAAAFSFDDSSEELQYGPGIVSKLRCRYLSLALRQSTSKQRPTLASMRRATSLNNLLNEDCDNGVNGGNGADGGGESPVINSSARSSWSTRMSAGGGGGYETKARTPDDDVSAQMTRSYIANVTAPSRQSGGEGAPNRHHRLPQRGNDSMKRARSVEALIRYDQSAWQRDQIHDHYNGGIVAAAVTSPESHVNRTKPPTGNGTASNGTGSTGAPAVVTSVVTAKHTTNVDPVSIEEKIVNGRERGEHKPKRLTSFMDETERPPPDLVKQTLRLFEATANRNPKTSLRSALNQSSDVAAKVNSFQTIIAQEKLPLVFPKPPLSPKKSLTAPLAAPRLTSPGPGKVSTAKAAGIMNGGSGGVLAPKPCTGVMDTRSRTPSPLTVRIDTAYRTNRLDSPLSPAQRNYSPFPASPLSPIQRMTVAAAVVPLHPAAAASPDLLRTANGGTLDSPLLMLTKKIDAMHIESPAVMVAAHSPSLASASEAHADDADMDAPTDSDGEQVDGVGAAAVTLRHISKTALSNISKAGTTTEFKFVAKSAKSHLPAATTMAVAAPLTSTVGLKTNTSTPKKPVAVARSSHDGSSSVTVEHSGPPPVPVTPPRQIGIIRPQPKAPAPTPTTATTNSAATSNVESSSSTSHVSHLIGAPKLVSGTNGTSNGHQSSDSESATAAAAAASTAASALTSREIEKNMINREKHIHTDDATASPASPAPTSTASISSKWMAPKGSPMPNHSAAGGAPTFQKPWQHSADPHNNSMVFNFSNRKDVPDYIENDGLVVRRKRELPKPGESGFVLLGDLTLETSTDPDDSWTLGPPSPCDVTFQNDNVVIDGKSCLRRTRVRQQKLTIHFNDTLTSTFEYPSESSLLLDYDGRNDDAADGSDDRRDGRSGDNNADDDGDDDDEASDGNGDGSASSVRHHKLSMGSAPLGSYTPQKVAINANFELGVTRSPTDGPTNGDAAGTTAAAAAAGSATGPESLQYLKPATDEQTVAWSEGTRVTDLLF